jgi:hypothetical protein
MDTDEIDAIMHTDKVAKRMYGGTVSIDNIPKYVKFPVCFIVNTSPSWHPGTHWVAVFASKNSKEYFCSYGSEPLPEIKKILGNSHMRKQSMFQSVNSDLCGQYCILYLLCKCRGFSYKKFASCFSPNQHLNDEMVGQVFKKYIRSR